VSWRILGEDLRSAREARPLPAKTTSFQEWSRRLAEFAEAGGLDGRVATLELPDQRQVAAHRRRWREHPGSVRTITVGLDADSTRALLQDVPGVYRTQVNDVLLSALGQTLGDWTGRGRVLGRSRRPRREQLFDDVTCSRTVGWFHLDFPGRTGHRGGTGRNPQGRQGKTCGRCHRRGGRLRGHCAISAGPHGHRPGDQLQLPGPVHRRRLDRRLPPTRASAGRTCWDVIALVQHDRLEFTWHYSDQVHTEATVRDLADGMLQCPQGTSSGTAPGRLGGRTPSDFPLARLTQSDVDGLVGDGRAVEDILPLTPLQAGMIFHSLVDGSSAPTSTRCSCAWPASTTPRVLPGPGNGCGPDAGCCAAGSCGNGLAEPVQVVQRDANLPVTILDWNADGPRRQAAGAVGQRPGPWPGPGCRAADAVTLAKLAADEVLLVWTFHHVLLDGWSLRASLVQEVCADYKESVAPGRVGPPFAEYLRWLSTQDVAEAEIVLAQRAGTESKARRRCRSTSSRWNRTGRSRARRSASTYAAGPLKELAHRPRV